MTKKAILLVLSTLLSLISNAGTLTGTILEAKSNEPVIGAVVMTQDSKWGTITDVDGQYSLTLPSGTYTIVVKMVGHETITQEKITISGNEISKLDLSMKENETTLSEVTVRATRQTRTELATLKEQKESYVVQTAVSAQQIARTQDKDASEVVRRVPGVSIIDDKFVLVRGLSQRYNSVWMNGGAVPSSEADSRAFSFDIIPAGQIDNITIVKSPAPEYPADFTGGFVHIFTKQNVDSPTFGLQVGTNFNTQTTFADFLSTRGHQSTKEMLATGIADDWTIRRSNALPDLKLNANYANSWTLSNSTRWGLISAVNFSNGRKTYTNMENSLYGPYDITNDKTVFLRRATDNQWSTDTRLGALLNVSLRPFGGSNVYEWKNNFQHITKNRYSDRWGFNAQPDNINDMEYYFTSRTTYNTQITGKHDPSIGKINWSAGYAYSNRYMPDRRLIERTDRTDETMGIYRISREFTYLDEHIFSLNANYTRDIQLSNLLATAKCGAYGEYRTRQYRTRQFQYGWNPQNTLPAGWLFDANVQGHVMLPENYGPDRLYLAEEVDYMNNYNGRQILGAGYAGVNVLWGNLSVYGGIRYENVRQILGLNMQQTEESMHDTNYDYSDIFPSLNVTYRFNDKHQLRAAYGQSVNRPEFRELSPSVFYDFDLGSSVMGNFDLKAAYIDNFDLRWEYYPEAGEQISVAFFYKHFKNPIEWTYTVAGGTDLIYSYINAKGATNYGIEVDIRKNLSFIGMRNFSVALNASLINSKVEFDQGSNNINRSMQGQSPYLVNAGLFYNDARTGWSASVLYNIIGKRIVGVGNRYGNASDGTSRNIPNSYELPRNVIDLAFGKTFGAWEVKGAIRNLLAQAVVFKQFEDVTVGGQSKTVEQITKKYQPGTDFSVSVGYKF